MNRPLTLEEKRQTIERFQEFEERERAKFDRRVIFFQRAVGVKEYLLTYWDERQRPLIQELMADMLDDCRAMGAWNIDELAVAIVNDGKTKEYLLKTHNRHAEVYGLPLIEGLEEEDDGFEEEDEDDEES